MKVKQHLTARAALELLIYFLWFKLSQLSVSANSCQRSQTSWQTGNSKWGWGKISSNIKSAGIYDLGTHCRLSPAEDMLPAHDGSSAFLRTPLLFLSFLYLHPLHSITPCIICIFINCFIKKKDLSLVFSVLPSPSLCHRVKVKHWLYVRAMLHYDIILSKDKNVDDGVVEGRCHMLKESLWKPIHTRIREITIIYRLWKVEA